MKKNRRAVSEIISTVLLIVVVISAIAMLGVFIKNYASQLYLSPEISCTQMAIRPPLIIERACWNQSAGDIELDLYRSADSIELKQINFNIDFGINSDGYQCSSSCGDCRILEAGERQRYFFSAEGRQPAKISISALGCSIDSKPVEAC